MNEDAVDGLWGSSTLSSSETDMRNELIEDGYTLVRKDSYDASASIISVLVKGITQLNKKGLPATFILVFDEAWQ